MTDDWKIAARKMIEGGEGLRATSRALGKSMQSIRWHLNINGYRDRNLAAARKSRGKPEAKHRHIVRRPDGDALDVPPVLLQRPITMPTFNLPPICDDIQPDVLTFAPRSRWDPENPRIERIRQVHRAMMRQGRAPSKDVFSVINR